MINWSVVMMLAVCFVVVIQTVSYNFYKSVEICDFDLTLGFFAVQRIQRLFQFFFSTKNLQPFRENGFRSGVKQLVFDSISFIYFGGLP
jgi:hypothetical protein